MYRSLYVFLLSLAMLSSGAGDLPVGNPSAGQFKKAVYYDPSVADPAPGQFKKAVYYRAGQRPFKVVAAQFTPSGNLGAGPAFQDPLAGEGGPSFSRCLREGGAFDFLPRGRFGER